MRAANAASRVVRDRATGSARRAPAPRAQSLSFGGRFGRGGNPPPSLIPVFGGGDSEGGQRPHPPCLGGEVRKGGKPPPSLARRRGRLLLSALGGSGRLTLVLLLGLGVLLT